MKTHTIFALLVLIINSLLLFPLKEFSVIIFAIDFYVIMFSIPWLIYKLTHNVRA